MDFIDLLRSLVAVIFLCIGGYAWLRAIALISPGQAGVPASGTVGKRDESIGIQERWGGFGHGLGGWQVTPAFALVLVGASSIGIGITVLQSVPELPAVDDADEDGVIDDNDKCPASKEDFDGHEDEDGCPDPDNDGDGHLDTNDQCPRDKEDVNGFDDQDGCPELGRSAAAPIPAATPVETPTPSLASMPDGVEP